MGIDATVVAAAATLGVGAFLKWAALPVIIAFELGRAVERIRNGGQAAAR